jgi:hypothetical protein
MEASAKTRTNVVEAFETLVREIKRFRQGTTTAPAATGGAADTGKDKGKKEKKRGGCSVL